MSPTPPRHRLAAGAVAGLAVAVCVLSGCGVPVDHSPSALSKVPFGLLDKSAPVPSTTTTTSPPGVKVTFAVFLVDAATGQLVPKARELPAKDETLAAVLEALIQGPTPVETLAGLQSAIPVDTTVLRTTVGHGASAATATLDFGGAFGQLVGQAQIQAVAQIVYTATALVGVNAVAFEIQGQPIKVPTASGALVSTATRVDFAALAPA